MLGVHKPAAYMWQICPTSTSGAKFGPEHGAAMQQVADWLEKLGMSEYAQRFAENRHRFFQSFPI